MTLACAQDFTPLGTEGVFWGSKGNEWPRGEKSQCHSPSSPQAPQVPRGLLGVASAGWRQASVKPAVAAIPAAERLRHRNSWGRTAPVCLPILFRLSALVRHWGHCLCSRLSGSEGWLGVAYAGQWQLFQDSEGHVEGQLKKEWRKGEKCLTREC